MSPFPLHEITCHSSLVRTQSLTSTINSQLSRFLIINADDYGLHPDVSRGIRDAHRLGIVSSTTAMMTWPSALDDIRIAQRDTPALGLGVHLCVTSGEPLLPKDQIPSLLNPHGNFFAASELTTLHAQLDPTELYAECKAQIERFRESGQIPTHLDSHHHAVYWSVPALRVLCQLAQDYDLPIRSPYATHSPGLGFAHLGPDRKTIEAIAADYKVRSTDIFVDRFFGDRVSVATLIDILQSESAASVEIMCHPGYWSEAVDQVSSYAKMREIELNVLTQAEVGSAVIENGWELGTFQQLTVDS